MRRAVRRTLAPSRAPLPAPADALERRLRHTSVWEQSSRSMADHDAIVRDQLRLGDAMLAQALAFEADICHCNDLDTLLTGLRVKQARAAGLVYDAHELWTEQHAPKRAREEHTEEYYGFYDDLLTTVAPLVDGAVTVNPSIALVLESRYPSLRFEVVWNCPSRVDDPLPRSGPLRDLAGSRRIVLMHGGLIAMDRGLDELLSAVEQTENALFVFRGSGSARPELERRAAESGLLGSRVVFEDPVPLAEVVTRGAEADIGVIPYKPTGINNLLSSPNKLFEYMMAGLAVAASDLPELRRIITAEDAGELFHPTRPTSIADALHRLTLHEGRLETCRRNARRASLERYNWESQSRALLDLYARVLSASRKSP
jgi:glycosyltransferase involved in cell wall biosynthesis